MTQHNVFILGMCALKALYSQVLSMSYRQGISLCSLWMKSRKKIHNQEFYMSLGPLKRAISFIFEPFLNACLFCPFPTTVEKTDKLLLQGGNRSCTGGIHKMNCTSLHFIVGDKKVAKLLFPLGQGQ